MVDCRPKERPSRLRCIILPVPPEKWHIKPFKCVLGISLWNLFVLSCFASRKLNFRGPGSSVGIATGSGRTVRGSNPGEGEIFRTCPDRPWGLPKPPVQWVPGLSRA
jgi:hypothetical protein